MPPATTEARRRFAWGDIAMALTAAAVLVIAGAWNRPIWLDEFLHFALGAMTFGEVLQTIDYTTIEINHGQTGIYMLADWALLQAFGANAVALRLPSLLSALALMFAAVVFLRNRGLSRFWQWLVLVALAGNQLWVLYVAEARPYMPLAASAVSLIAFYAASPEQRLTWPVRILAVIGLLLGAILHPYWIYFLLMAIAFGLLLAWTDQTWSFKPKSLWRFSGGPLLILSLLLFFIIGQLTWMRRVREFAYDPFEWFASPSDAVSAFLRLHIYGDYPFVWALLFVLTLAALIQRPWRAKARLFIPPIALIVIGISGSLAVSAISASRQYWIFERQWVAGVAAAVVAFVWLFGLIWQQSDAGRLQWRRWPSVLFTLVVFVGAIASAQQALNTRSTWSEEQHVFYEEDRAASELLVDLSDQSVIYAANVNIARGGPVWPELLKWYYNQAGMRPEFRVTNPSWSDSLLPSRAR